MPFSPSLSRPRCSACGGEVAKQTVHRDATSAQRLVCGQCSADFPLSEVCAVCGTAWPERTLAVTVHRSGTLGTHTVRHCAGCKPPSKVALEFQTSFGTSLIKYGCGLGCAGFLLLSIVMGLLSAGHR
jgi:hypothetical protein